MSDGRLVQIAWAVHRGRPLPDLPVWKDAEPESEAPRTRPIFLVLLGLAFVAAMAVSAYGAAGAMLLIFGVVALAGGLRSKAF